MVKEQIGELLNLLGFKQEGNKYTKKYDTTLHPLVVDVERGCIYYENSGITVTRETTSNLSEPENLVVLECVDRLLSMGYSANHIELEPQWKLGHSQKGGFADIWVRTYSDDVIIGSEVDKQSLLIIECKTAGAQFTDAWNDTLDDGAQLFSYFQQEPQTKFLCLYTSDIVDGKIKPEYKLINVQDNKDLLESDQSAQSYQDKNDKQRYRVWRDTYGCEHATRGLFERDILPYEIGKNKYTINDLTEVDNNEIQKKYHEFALILRQHNVSGRENAFDKLVNLFLAKVVDETNNPEDLHFYWKGTAYDDDFQLQDRLQRLYRDGMMRFLKEKVTYIENKQIDLAFRRFKNDPDATKKTIKEYFRALKFFSDNDFSFISVHNEKLFRQNAVVLRKMVKMLQDIRLKTDGTKQNQFLGDLFEGFLNRGIKQSEGQFFTPMPIVRFIVSSLPLEHIIRDNEDIPWAIDYACGAGHFLTEYAVRIKEFVEKYRKDIPLEEYYARITGVEKEYRLSKVSKVSAFMYGQDDINIVYADALVKHPDVHDGKYEVLVANPPYAVSGFLDTLSDEQRKCYSLYNANVNTDKNNVIEAFFIERAAQLMKTGGVAGIILPVSMLNRNGMHAHAREIILQNFDIVALAEFGSGTFGQTGTNTVTMFLRRKETNTPDYEHYKYRVDSWFAQRNETNAVYKDEYLLDCYCKHCDYKLEDYKAFIVGSINDSFLNTETVQAYYVSFFGNQRNAMKDVSDEAKTIRNKYLSRSNTKAYKALPLLEQNKIKEQAFLDFVTAIEKEKVYYYVLAYTVSQPVLLIKTPTTTAGIKTFLGYGWSGSKGNEGIQYLNVGKSKTEEDNEDEEEDDTMNQIRGIGGIQTPLFDPSNLADDDKINTLIRKNFMGENIMIPSDLAEYVSKARLVDMIDFSRTAFNKEFKTSVSSVEKFDSKFSLVKLGSLINGTPQYGANQKAVEGNPLMDYRYIRITDINEDGTLNDDWKTVAEVEKQYILKEGDVLFARSGATAGKAFYYKNEYGKALYAGYLIRFRFDESKVIPLFVYNLLCSKEYNDWVEKTKGGTARQNINSQQYCSFEVPLPPMDIQKKIVEKCEKIDQKFKQQQLELDSLNNRVESIFDEVTGRSQKLEKLCSAINPSKADVKSIEASTMVSFVEMSSVSNDGYIEQKIDKPLADVRKGSYTYFAEGDIIIAKITPCMENGKCALATGLTNGIGFGSSEFHVLRVNDKLINNVYLFAYLNRKEIRERAAAVMTGASGHRRVPITFYEELEIPVPSMDEQLRIVAEYQKNISAIMDLRESMSNASSAKQAILDKYLK